MTNRITRADLQRMTYRMNELEGRPTEPYTEHAGVYNDVSVYTAALGCYHIERVNGLYRVAEIVNASGATRNVTELGTPRETAAAINAFITGWYSCSMYRTSQKDPDLLRKRS